jgi:hypothetical protein
MNTSINPSVLVIGGSYAGLHAAELLAQQLPSHWSVTLVERNTHFNVSHHLMHKYLSISLFNLVCLVIAARLLVPQKRSGWTGSSKLHPLHCQTQQAQQAHPSHLQSRA